MKANPTEGPEATELPQIGDGQTDDVPTPAPSTPVDEFQGQAVPLEILRPGTEVSRKVTFDPKIIEPARHELPSSKSTLPSKPKKKAPPLLKPGPGAHRQPSNDFPLP